MSKLSFPTRKLKGSIRRITTRYDSCNSSLAVYGVTNTQGLVITGKNSSEDTSKYIVVSENQFVYNPYRVNVGSIGLAPSQFKGIVSPAYVVFETLADIVPEFLCYYLKSTIGLNLIRWYGNRGGVRLSLTFENLGQVDFPDISREQQSNALATIKNFGSRLDKLLGEQNRQKVLIQKLRQEILQEAVSGKLVSQDPNDEPASELLKKIKSEKKKLIEKNVFKEERGLQIISTNEIRQGIPHSWIFVRLHEICSLITDGTHQTPNYSEEGRPFLSAQNIKPFRFMPQNHRWVSEIDYQNYIRNKKPELNDVLLTRVGAGIGEAALIDKRIDFAIYVSLALIKTFNQYVDPNYLCIWLNSPTGREKSSSNTLGVGHSQGNLNLALINNFVISLPPFNEQKRIVEKVNRLMKLCDRLEEEAEENRKISESLMEAVLKEAFAF